jgi:hypothetical protein
LVCGRAGTAAPAVAGRPPEPLARADAVSVPPALRWAIRDCSPDLELLDVTLPASVTPT